MIEPDEEESWLDSGEHTEESVQIDDYDITAAPNDFNVKTIFDFIESGAVVIPGFQRNYVWDLRRASKLIESLIIGLPVPQVFLYEESRNKFLVIDGQQRLMSIYYFVKGRFPKKEKRVELRAVFDEHGMIPDEILGDDTYFDKFSLSLPEFSPGVPNRFNRLNYQTLGDYQMSLNLRTIRNMIVKQVKPTDDHSSMYELFNRLNTGGVLLSPQEIRSSLYHSHFYDELFKLNLDPRWRSLIGQPQPNLHMRDIEVMLRGIALWKNSDRYAPSMVKFLNRFSNDAKSFTGAETASMIESFEAFLDAAVAIPRESFLTGNGRFSQALFESVFASTASEISGDPDLRIDGASVQNLAESETFRQHSEKQTTDTSNVQGRIKCAREIVVFLPAS